MIPSQELQAAQQAEQRARAELDEMMADIRALEVRVWDGMGWSVCGIGSVMVDSVSLVVSLLCFFD